jgi:hypothetical protein
MQPCIDMSFTLKNNPFLPSSLQLGRTRSQHINTARLNLWGGVESEVERLKIMPLSWSYRLNIKIDKNKNKLAFKHESLFCK